MNVHMKKYVINNANLFVLLRLQYSIICKHIFEILHFLSLKSINVPQCQFDQCPTLNNSSQYFNKAVPITAIKIKQNSCNAAIHTTAIKLK